MSESDVTRSQTQTQTRPHAQHYVNHSEAGKADAHRIRLEQAADLAAGLSADDIVAGVYEGGFKTWECAADLARYVLEGSCRAQNTAGGGGLGSGDGSELADLDIDGRAVHVIEVSLSL